MPTQDLFLLHDPTGTREERIKGWKALLKVQSEGKVKSVGVSNFVSSQAQVRRWRAGLWLTAGLDWRRLGSTSTSSGGRACRCRT